MAIDLRTLNYSEATLKPRDPRIQTSYRVDPEKIKEKLVTAKEEGAIRDIVQISGKTDDVKNLSDNMKPGVYSNYSVSAFFTKDGPTVKTGDNFLVSGVAFSEEDMAKARSVMKAAVNGIDAGPGKNTNLDYRTYAQMEIAQGGVAQFAKDNFTEEQQAVINKAMQEYNDALVDWEKSHQGETVTNFDKNTSVFYGKSKVLTDGDKEAIKKIAKEFADKLGTTVKNEDKIVKDPVVVPSATNKEKIDEVRNVFKNMDFKDTASIDNAMNLYKELMTPVNKAYGGNASQDVAGFMSMIKNIGMVHSYKSLDVSL